MGHYREEGFLSDALVNYLALVGWAYDDKTELFTREELVKYFTLEKVAKHGAIFDLKKLEWMNGVYIRETPLAELAKYAHQRLHAAGLVPAQLDDGLQERLEQMMEPLQTRMRTLAEIVPQTYYFFTDELQFDDKAVRRFLERDYVPEFVYPSHPATGCVGPVDARRGRSDLPGHRRAGRAEIGRRHSTGPCRLDGHVRQPADTRRHLLARPGEDDGPFGKSRGQGRGCGRIRPYRGRRRVWDRDA